MKGAFRQRLRRRGLLASGFAPVRYLWIRAVRSPRGAHYVAGGFAIGMFWASIPIFILHLPFALLTAYLLRTSRLAATAAVFLSNPFTIAPQYTLCWLLGHAVTSSESSAPAPGFGGAGSMWESMMALGWLDFRAMLIGGAILGASLCVPAYFVALRLAQRELKLRRANREQLPGYTANGEA